MKHRRGPIIQFMLILTLLLPVALTAVASAADAPFSTLSLRVENDAIHGTDANYTSGLALEYTRNDSGLLGNIWNSIGLHDGRKFSSYQLDQLFFTPTNLKLNPPDPHGRPYASLLYLGLTTDLQTEANLHALQLLVGVVGPMSLGKESQCLSHSILKNPHAQGWGHQLKNEPLLNINYEYRRRYRLEDHGTGFGLDLIPIGTAMLGNYQIRARAEAQLRFGYRLPDDFGQSTLRGIGTIPLDSRSAGNSWGAYLFAGAGGDMVARDITLDGNSFRNGPSIGKHTFVSFGTVGISVRAGNFQSSVSYILCGKEFKGQLKGEQYGSAMITYIFR